MRGTATMERKGIELGVGVFLLIGILCLAYLSIRLGDVRLFGGSTYEVHARFASVAGLKPKAIVTMAGVDIGQVKGVRLKDGQALVTFSINEDVQLEEDAIVSIKTMGIIGDKYVAIDPGASDVFIEPGGMIRETRAPFDIESMLGKFVFGSMENQPKQ
jgi:phospholipid/cholesterol/gamma-HCH transport system substrate-binding protein